MSFCKLLREKSHDVWEDCYRHPFVQELGQGILAKEKFQFYLIQDYKYLLEYAKVFALGAIKAKDEKLMTSFTLCQCSILQHEMSLHREYMTKYDISSKDAECSKTALFNSAYTANMLTVGERAGALEILAVILPCAWSYYDFASRLKEEYKEKVADNYYKSWLDMYTGKEYFASFSWMFDTLDELAAGKTKTELDDIQNIFQSSVEFEYLFWDMAYKQQVSF